MVARGQCRGVEGKHEAAAAECGQPAGRTSCCHCSRLRTVAAGNMAPPFVFNDPHARPGVAGSFLTGHRKASRVLGQFVFCRRSPSLSRGGPCLVVICR
ncbi:hypothetical protein SZ55_5393 [Pseudomonas sp. FeS53a]|nr:hypothetical protein SZ55_5393 [Pseudomonas sp. FeS53a]